MANLFKKIWWKIKLFSARIYYGNPSKKLKIIGVTGTNGKTTTTTLLYKTASLLGHKSGLIGTVEILINGQKFEPKGKVPATTPDSVTLTKVFAEMVKAGCEYVFMEVSSHAVDQNRIAGIKFAGGIFTNLTHDHLDYHKTFKNYFEAKKKFFDGLPASAWALTNADDEYGKRMTEDTKAQVFYYGFDYKKDTNSIDPTKQDFLGIIESLTSTGTKIKVNNYHEIDTHLIGGFNAYNLSAVFGATALLGFDTGKVIHILENIEPPRGRFERVIGSSGVIGLVDYAHSPDAVHNVLTTINQIKGKNKVISVFGCGGDRDSSKRAAMGEIGAQLSDIAIFTSDNPRSENPNEIIEAMKNNLTPEIAGKVLIFPDRGEAIRVAAGYAEAGDIIAVLGKGHEDYQEVNGTKNHFSDIEELQKIL